MDIYFRFETLGFCVFACSLFACDAFGDVEGGRLAQRDFVCGPRCLMEIFRRLDVGGDTQLIDIVRETQWPDIEQGASLASLCDACLKRGVRAKACKIDPKQLAYVDWKYPFIVHVNFATNQTAKSDASSPMGHYLLVDCMASTASNAAVYEGLAGKQQLSWAKLEEIASGNVLLVSDESSLPSTLPIRSQQLAFLNNAVRNLEEVPFGVLLLSFLFLVMILLALLFSNRSRTTVTTFVD